MGEGASLVLEYLSLKDAGYGWVIRRDGKLIVGGEEILCVQGGCCTDEIV